jgi:hypothetical protein
MRDGIRSLRNQHVNPKSPDDKQRGKRGKPDSSGRRDLKAVGRGEGVNFPITRGGELSKHVDISLEKALKEISQKEASFMILRLWIPASSFF